MDNDALRIRLEALLLRTKGAKGSEASGWWSGDKAGERRTLDDLKAGRLNYRTALHHARMGLEAHEAGNFELAEAHYLSGDDHYKIALEREIKRVRPSDRGGLGKPARRRGRPPKK